MNKKIFIKLGLPTFAITALMLFAAFWVQDNFLEVKTGPQSRRTLASIQPEGQPITEKVIPFEQRYPHIIKSGSSLVLALKDLGVDRRQIYELITAADAIKDLGRLDAGTRFQLNKSPYSTELLSLRIRLTPLDILVIEKGKSGEWLAQKIVKEVDKKIVTFKGIVKSSLWESALEANMHPSLISELSEIFAWQVDFAREVRSGDVWRLSVEETYIQGEKIGWGSILSAEYTNVAESHTAVLFRKDGKDVGYYAPDGSSLKRIFLKSPIHFARISSRYNKRRLHPVLKSVRPHNGVDYAAPTGTPIRVVGDGVVWAKGYNKGAGNYIKVRHNSTYMTAYKHLSRFPKGMKKGAKVQQGQTIGYVGSTGLATGPHLHFEFYVNNRFVDPLGMRFPAADPVLEQDLALFEGSREIYLAYLPDWGGLGNEELAH